MAEWDVKAGNGGNASTAPPSRDDVAQAIYAELALVVRRFRAQAAELHPGLSLTAYTLLLHLEETGGSRAAELVEYYQLNKSTVSRQLAELASDGLVERQLDEADSRIQIVHISEAGRSLLAEVGEALQRGMRTRLDAWPDEDLAAFAKLLQRYNAHPAGAEEGASTVGATATPTDRPDPDPDQDQDQDQGRRPAPDRRLTVLPTGATTWT
jgi:DNA-binding MarR family transcriptional regulator